jgi:antitoxin VapB
MFWPVLRNFSVKDERRVRLFRNGGNQALRIPVEFELPGDEAVVHREGNRLVVEPLERRSLLQILATLEPIEEEFPDVDAGLAPPRPVDL